jgi:hypothetical protein
VKPLEATDVINCIVVIVLLKPCYHYYCILLKKCMKDVMEELRYLEWCGG